MNKELITLSDIIVPLAKAELLPRFTRVKRGEKLDGSVITEADIVMQDRVRTALYEQWPAIGFLGEEMSAGEQVALLATGEPLWCLDPLDGTSNFAVGIPHFAVSLALLQDGQVKLALVYDPVREECFTASAGEGAYLNGGKLVAPPVDVMLSQSTALIDFKRLPSELSARLVTERPYASQRSFGSVALDWCWLAAGRCHVYLHGRSNIWDYAAGHLVFQEAGGHSTTLQGEDVFINELKPRAAVGALDKGLFDDWVEWLGVPLS
ncbi:MAG: inositol monophosphatase [Gammaproteobacteria bacterium]